MTKQNINFDLYSNENSNDCINEIIKDLQKTLHGSMAVIDAIDSGKEINIQKAVRALCVSQKNITFSMLYLMGIENKVSLTQEQKQCVNDILQGINRG